MGQLLAVHDEKLTKQDRIDAVLFEKIEQVDEKLDRHATDIKKGCERDIRKVDDRLRLMEKKMWTIAGGLAVITFLISVPGLRVMKNLTNNTQTSMMSELSVQQIERVR